MQTTQQLADEDRAKAFADSQFIKPYEDLPDSAKDAWIAFYDGFLAGCQQLTQQQQGMQWVKCSEKMPDEITARTIIRHLKLRGNLVDPDWFVQCKELPGFDGLQNYEWLDESTSQQLPTPPTNQK